MSKGHSTKETLTKETITKEIYRADAPVIDKKIVKKDTKKIGLDKFSGSEINAAIKILSPLNPNWNTWFKPGPQRTSVSKLLKFTKEDGNDLKSLVEKALSLRGIKYQVQIFNPCEMVEKYSKLVTTKKEISNNVKKYDKADPSRYKDKKPAVVFNNNKK